MTGPCNKCGNYHEDGIDCCPSTIATINTIWLMPDPIKAVSDEFVEQLKAGVNSHETDLLIARIDQLKAENAGLRIEGWVVRADNDDDDTVVVYMNHGRAKRREGLHSLTEINPRTLSATLIIHDKEEKT